MKGMMSRNARGFLIRNRSINQSGSLALAALAVTKGARILRVHDVAETVDVVRMIAAVESAD